MKLWQRSGAGIFRNGRTQTTHTPPTHMTNKMAFTYLFFSISLCVDLRRQKQKKNVLAQQVQKTDICAIRTVRIKERRSVKSLFDSLSLQKRRQRQSQRQRQRQRQRERERERGWCRSRARNSGNKQKLLQKETQKPLA